MTEEQILAAKGAVEEGLGLITSLGSGNLVNILQLAAVTLGVVLTLMFFSYIFEISRFGK